MRAFVVAAALWFLWTAVVSENVDLDRAWLSFKNLYNKTYENSVVEQQRRHLWEVNLDIISRHNLLAAQGKYSFTLGMNELGDMTSEEVRQQMTGFIMPSAGASSVRNATVTTTVSPRLPATVDWRKKGYVTPVKNQGKCGACWAFAATGAMEAQHFRSKGKLVSLSEQNLIDCSHPQGNHGCEGGIMDAAFKYAQQMGVDTEKSYPFAGKDGPCRFRSGHMGAKLSGFTDVKRQDEAALAVAVAGVGPVAVAIDAGHPSFHLYRDGVYDEPKCSPMALNHGVLVVGFGSHAGQDYWLVKNSWGESWGKNGYIMMSRNKNNQCGIATLPSYPLV